MAKIPESALKYYGRRFVEKFFECIGDYSPSLVVAIDQQVCNVIDDAARRAAEDFKTYNVVPPPIESYSLEADISNFEQRTKASNVPTGEMIARLIAILRRINREKSGVFAIPVMPSPVAAPTPWTPNLPPTSAPYNPFPNPTIICSGKTSDATLASGAGQSFYRPENPPALQRAIDNLKEWAVKPSEPDATGTSEDIPF